MMSLGGTKQGRQRRRRRLTRGAVVLACLSSVVGESHVTLNSVVKKPPPPPPPRQRQPVNGSAKNREGKLDQIVKDSQTLEKSFATDSPTKQQSSPSVYEKGEKIQDYSQSHSSDGNGNDAFSVDNNRDGTNRFTTSREGATPTRLDPSKTRSSASIPLNSNDIQSTAWKPPPPPKPPSLRTDEEKNLSGFSKEGHTCAPQEDCAGIETEKPFQIDSDDRSHSASTLRIGQSQHQVSVVPPPSSSQKTDSGSDEYLVDGSLVNDRRAPQAEASSRNDISTKSGYDSMGKQKPPPPPPKRGDERNTSKVPSKKDFSSIDKDTKQTVVGEQDDPTSKELMNMDAMNVSFSRRSSDSHHAEGDEEVAEVQNRKEEILDTRGANKASYSHESPTTSTTLQQSKANVMSSKMGSNQYERLAQTLQSGNFHGAKSGEAPWVDGSTQHSLPSRGQSMQQRPIPLTASRNDLRTQQPVQSHTAYSSTQYGHRQQPQNTRQYRSYAASKPAAVMTSSTLKTLWSKVERRLDDLANLEDTLSDRAQQIVSSVSIVPTRWSSQQRQSHQSETVVPWRMKRQEVRPGPTTEQLNPYGQKYEEAKRRQQDQTNKNVQTNQASGDSRQIVWSDVAQGKKLLRANGGATEPNLNGSQASSSTISSSTTSPITAEGALPPPPPQHQQYQQQQQQQQQQQRILQQQPLSLSTSAEHSAGPQSSSTVGGNFEPSPYVQPGTAQAQQSSKANSMNEYRSSWGKFTQNSQRQPTQSQPAQRRSFEFEDDSSSWRSRIANFIPSMPRIPSPSKLFRFRKGDTYSYASLDAWNVDDDSDSRSGFFGWKRQKRSDEQNARSLKKSSSKDSAAALAPLGSLMARCDNGKTASLLSRVDDKKFRSVGRRLAVFDAASATFLLLGLQQLRAIKSISRSQLLKDIASKKFTFGDAVTESLAAWTLMAFASAFLTRSTCKLLLANKLRSLANKVATTVQEEAQYAQLYLRLTTGRPMDSRLAHRISRASHSEAISVVATSRLETFVILVLSLLVLTSVAIIRPVANAIGRALVDLLFLDDLLKWPAAWSELASIFKGMLASAGSELESVISPGISEFLDNPLRFAFHLSFVASMFAVLFIPRIEQRRKVQPSDEEDEDGALTSIESAEKLSNLGMSSASRLGLLAENGSVEHALERWRMSRSLQLVQAARGVSIGSHVKYIGYGILTAAVIIVPLIMSRLVATPSSDLPSPGVLRWDSLLDLSVILSFVFFLTGKAIGSVISSIDSRPAVMGFLLVLSGTLDEVRNAQRQTQIQFPSSVSPASGISVSDLWAAYMTKRAWAVRGATLTCKNGEVLIVLGDDGAGKTRLLTSIAESMLSPPKLSLSSTKVRGAITLGGLDVSKWDTSQLKRRLGVLLADVRTVADFANLVSGLTLDEILEPIDGNRSVDASHKLGANERSAILLALKVTGLYATLLPKLPSKLSTAVTANEEELQASSLRPRSNVLSPSEWSKLILAKILAQTMYDNENAVGSNDKVENRLMGSALLLDEPTALMSEMEESNLYRELRKSGAATIISSNKWAAGRFADRIVVIKDGAIVESGTHNELISKGPQQSLYAAKWHAMTTQ